MESYLVVAYALQDRHRPIVIVHKSHVVAVQFFGKDFNQIRHELVAFPRTTATERVTLTAQIKGKLPVMYVDPGLVILRAINWRVRTHVQASVSGICTNRKVDACGQAKQPDDIDSSHPGPVSRCSASRHRPGGGDSLPGVCN